MHAVGNVIAARLVDGEDISELKSDTLVANTLKEQLIAGKKHFATRISIHSNMTVSGLLDGRVIDQNRVLDLKSEQIISGDVNVHNDVHVSENVSLQGKLSGNDLNAINKDRITLDTDQVIGRNLHVLSNVESRNISVVGTTNGVHLNQYKSNVDEFAGKAWRKGMQVYQAVRKRCPAFEYARRIIEGKDIFCQT